MAFTPTQEAQLLELINQQAALLSLAGNEASITSALGAEQVNLSELTPATTIADADLLLVRQGVTDKSTSVSILKSGLLADDSVTTAKIANDAVTFAKIQNIATARVLGRTTAGSGDVEELTTLPAVNGAAVTDLNASALASGTVPTARLGSGTANSTTFLRGDQTYAPAGLLAASTGEARAGTSDTVAITPLKLREGLNASGTAPIYACRAWVNFNGTGTVAIRASGNVSSITDNTTGDYTVNLTTEMPDANYSVSGMCRQTPGGNNFKSGAVSFDQTGTALSTGSFRIKVTSGDNTLGYDVDLVTVAIFR